MENEKYSEPSVDYPLGGSIEPYDIEVEKELLDEVDTLHLRVGETCPIHGSEHIKDWYVVGQADPVERWCMECYCVDFAKPYLPDASDHKWIKKL